MCGEFQRCKEPTPDRPTTRMALMRPPRVTRMAAGRDSESERGTETGARHADFRVGNLKCLRSGSPGDWEEIGRLISESAGAPRGRAQNPSHQFDSDSGRDSAKPATLGSRAHGLAEKTRFRV